MRIDAGLDTGDILLQSEERIKPEDTALTLAPRLAQTGAELMIRTLAGLKNGTIRPRPQDDAQATLAPILTREDGLIDFSRTRDGNVEPSAGISAVAGGLHFAFAARRCICMRRYPRPRSAVVAPASFRD